RLGKLQVASEQATRPGRRFEKVDGYVVCPIVFDVPEAHLHSAAALVRRQVPQAEERLAATTVCRVSAREEELCELIAGLSDIEIGSLPAGFDEVSEVCERLAQRILDDPRDRLSLVPANIFGVTADRIVSEIDEHQTRYGIEVVGCVEPRDGRRSHGAR